MIGWNKLGNKVRLKQIQSLPWWRVKTNEGPIIVSRKKVAYILWILVKISILYKVASGNGTMVIQIKKLH